ncbi:MAG TPA: transglutaminase family protein [Planctomycetaceae bacterium]|nr:transglutaminase family protein [Planctomycetaceae bacterium]
MHYKITHTTTYAYGDAVPVCHNEVRLTPREGPALDCRTHRLVIKPTPTTSNRRRDFFGNHVHTFSIEESHRKMSVTATSRVAVRPPETPPPDATPPWESLTRAERLQELLGRDWIDAWQFTFESSSARPAPELAEYARASFTPGRPVLAAVLDLTRRIHADFKYETGTTHVATSAEEAFRLRRGVCQDFAHIEIACLRALGLPARYVSGYLRTIPPPGKPRLTGADASHAWLSAWCGEAGWIDVDPTNNTVCGTDHITLAWGREYSDVCPIRGVFIGGGTHELNVSVDVLPLEAAADHDA